MYIYIYIYIYTCIHTDRSRLPKIPPTSQGDDAGQLRCSSLGSTSRWLFKAPGRPKAKPTWGLKKSGRNGGNCWEIMRKSGKPGGKETWKEVDGGENVEKWWEMIWKTLSQLGG